MSDLMVLAERYAAFTIRAERLQAAMDAIARAEPDVEMYAMIDSLKVRRDKELTDRASIQLEMMNLLDEMRGGTPSHDSLGSPRVMTSKTASRISGPSKVIILKGEPKSIDGGNRMCGYEICPMMNGDKWPDCKKCPYADGTEGGERMTDYHVGYGISGISAGTVRDYKDGRRIWTKKSDVTDEALGAVAEYLLDQDVEIEFSRDGREYVLKVEQIPDEGGCRWYRSTSDAPRGACSSALTITRRVRGSGRHSTT